jgi:hypothetical protein
LALASPRQDDTLLAVKATTEDADWYDETVSGGLVVANDPINATDPTGMWFLRVFKAAKRVFQSKGDLRKAGIDEIASIGDDLATLGNGQAEWGDLLAIIDTVVGTDLNNPKTKTANRSSKLKSDSRAEGPHTTFKTDKDRNVTRHETWEPNPQNPSGFDSKQSTDVDVNGKAHHNKVTGEDVPTPHTQGKDIPGGVRPAKPEEIPKRRESN